MPQKETTEKQKELIEDSLGDLLDGLYKDVLDKMSVLRPNQSDEEKTNVLNDVNTVLKSSKEFDKAAKKGGDEVEAILTSDRNIKSQAKSLKEVISPYYRGAKSAGGVIANAARRARREIDLNTMDPFVGRADYIKAQREKFKEEHYANDKLKLLENYGKSEGISTLQDARDLIDQSLSDRANSFPESERKREAKEEALKKLPKEVRKNLEKSYEYKEAESDIDQQNALIQQEQDIVNLDKAKQWSEAGLSVAELKANGFSQNDLEGLEAVKSLGLSPREYIQSRNIERQQEQQDASSRSDFQEQSSTTSEDRKPTVAEKAQEVFGQEGLEDTYYIPNPKQQRGRKGQKGKKETEIADIRAEQDELGWENPTTIPIAENRKIKGRGKRPDVPEQQSSDALREEAGRPKEEKYRPRSRNTPKSAPNQKYAASQPKGRGIPKDYYFQSTRALPDIDEGHSNNHGGDRKHPPRENRDTADGLSQLVPSEDRIKMFEQQFKKEQRKQRQKDETQGQKGFADRFDPNNRPRGGRDGR